VTLQVTDLAAEERFMATLAEACGWLVAPGPVVHAGALSVALRAGPSSAGLALDVVASRKQVSAPLLAHFPEAEREGGLLQLCSPGGITWNVTFLTPGRGSL
jgi:hypothetical protein